MADAFTLATTLPPDLFQGNKAVALAPVVSATYESTDFTRGLNTRSHLANYEAISRAVMSGQRDLADNVIDKVKKDIEAYHMGNIAKMPVTKTATVLGMHSLKSITMKHSQKAME